MKKISPAFLMALLFVPLTVFAGTAIVEGDQAKALYNADKGKAQVLVQKNKIFILRAPNGEETSNPNTIKVKVGERFYIANEEEIFIHNVYDTTDSNWVLKKQTPSNVAAITFDAPGKHSLHCAIHPTMEIDVNVMP